MSEELNDTPATGASESVGRLAGIWIGIFVLHVLLHLPFALFDEMAEPDAGRLMIDAMVLAEEGPGSLSGYRVRTSTAYLIFLSELLKHELVTVGGLPRLMTWLSLLSGGVAIVVGGILVRRWFRSWSMVGAFVVLIELCPIFWFANIAGFPTMPATAMFLICLWLADLAFTGEKPARNVALGTAAILLFLLASMVKIDVLALTPAFLGLILWRCDRSRWIRLAACVLAPAGVIFIIGAFTAGHYAEPRPATDFWANWDKRWPAAFSTLFSVYSFARYFCGAGVLLPLLAGVCLLVMFRRAGEDRRLCWFLLMWILPATIFWMSRPGGARHFLTVYFPIAVAASWITVWRPNWRVFGPVLAVVVLVNFFLWPARADTLRPSGRLFASSVAFKKEAVKRHQVGRRVAEEIRTRDGYVYGAEEYMPYVIFEVCRQSSERATRLKQTSLMLDQEVSRGFQIRLPDGSRRQLGYRYSTPSEEAMAAYRKSGRILFGPEEILGK